MIALDIHALVAALAKHLQEHPEDRRELVAALGIGETEGKADRYVSVATYAELHELGESTVRGAIRAGRLEAVRNGGAVRVRANALIAAPKSTDTPAARAARAWGRVAGGGR